MSPEERIAQFEQENTALRRTIEELREENAGLRRDLEKVRREVEEWKRGFRERRKRRTSRAEGRGRSEPKKPGRKAGHPAAHRAVPEAVDHEKVHPTPTTCPDCGGAVEQTEQSASTLEIDIPPVTPEVTRHTTRVGRCTCCKARVVSRLPGASPNGTTVAPVTFGPTLQAMALSLRFEVKAPLGGIGAFMGQWIGVPITAGALARMFDRLRGRSEPALKEIVTRVRRSKVVGMDETGLRQNGAKGWCWIARTEKVSLYRIELSRGRWVVKSILGKTFKGELVTDFYSAYAGEGSWKTWTSAFCGAHVIREAKKIAELQPCAQTENFRDRLKEFYATGEAAAQSKDFFARRGARTRLGHLIASTDYVDFPAIVQLQQRLDDYKDGITRFLDVPSVPWHNNATERDLRVIARFRAITGGTRSERGSATLGHWMSIIHTRRKNGLPLHSFIQGMHDAHLQGRAPPSVFAN